MGAGVSGWRLASAVSSQGHLGVVSGTALDVIMVRRLQLGDPGGHLRQAFASFPFPEIVRRVWQDYFIEGEKKAGTPFKNLPLFSVAPSQLLIGITVLANFAEVFLAKAGHYGSVGINFLEKIQLPLLPSIYGAMLAGVDYVLVGAGIPRSVPGILDRFAAGQPARYSLDVTEADKDDEFSFSFDPAEYGLRSNQPLKRPKFLAIISSATLALALARKSTGSVDGFVVEGSSAGGHNAPPRGPLHLNERGEPIYGERDLPELQKIKALGLPFWLAGSYAAPGKLDEALQLGAVGVQVGTAFAFCRESDIDPVLKQRVLRAVREGRVDVLTDPLASPTGFPLKLVVSDELTEAVARMSARRRQCDLGYLRHLYKKSDGTLGYRCPGESEESYRLKGGESGDTLGRRCVCNGLLATIGLAQSRQDGGLEPPLLTAGDDLRHIHRYLTSDLDSYSAADVIRQLSGKIRAA